MGVYNGFLAVIAVLALVVLAVPELQLFLLLSFVGIPLGLAMPFLPALAAILVGARVLDQLVLGMVLRTPLLRWLGSVALVGAALFQVADSANRAQRRVIDGLIAGDHVSLPAGLPPVATLAFLVAPGDSTPCDDLCRKLLLSGAAGKVLSVRAILGGAAPDPAQEAFAWWFETRDTCPDMREDTHGAIAARMLAEIAQGRCLVSGQVPLAEADMILSRQRVRSANPKSKISYSRGLDLIDATRHAVWLPEGTGYAEAARWTSASAQTMMPPAVPTIVHGYFPTVGIGFPRGKVTVNAETPGFDAIVTTVLGLDLTLPEQDSRAPLIDALTVVLDADGPFDANAGRLVRGYVDAATRRDPATRRDVALTERDRDIFLRLVADPRVPLPSNASQVPARLPGMTPALQQDLARAGFARIAADNDAGRASRILAKLPDAALLPWRDAIFALAEDRARREHARELLERLRIFGAAGAERLLFLVADAEAADAKGNLLWGAYMGGMTGLCRMGPEAAHLAGDLAALAREGKVRFREGSHLRLEINTLVRMGIPPEEVRALALAAGMVPRAPLLVRPQAAGADPPPDSLDMMIYSAQRRATCH